ncbi:MAG: C-GCAxxG-C-C family protein [Promethearchaeota archaeon]
MKNSKKAKKIARKAQWTYFSTCTCSLTQIKPFQEAFDKIDDDVLKAAIGLEGGMFQKGSTCGVVFSGALTLAMLMDSEISKWKAKDEIKLHGLIKDYSTWFNEKYGSTLCRERNGMNLWKLRGVLGCFLPHLIYKGLSHSGGASKYLYSIKDLEPEIDLNHDSDFPNRFHCAKQVLEKIRNETGVGNSTVERISLALDGGVGLQGGACGAMAGAVMAISLHLGKNFRKSGTLSNWKDFLQSPKKLSKQKSFDDFFSVGGKLMDSFLELTPSFECKEICNTTFNSWKEFQQFGTSDSSKVCHELIDFAANKAIELINKKDE